MISVYLTYFSVISVWLNDLDNEDEETINEDEETINEEENNSKDFAEETAI